VATRCARCRPPAEKDERGRREDMDKGNETADEAVRRRVNFYIIRRAAVAGVREKGHEREDDNAKIDLSSRNRVAK
jgi:hypothetical protein